MLNFETASDSLIIEKKEDWEPIVELPEDYNLPAFNSAELIPGENQTIQHPEIISSISAHEKLLPNAKVQVAYGPHYIESTSIDDYLRHIGSEYRFYEGACERMRQWDNKYLFLELHKKAIVHRFHSLKERYDGERTRADQNQAVSAREHSVVWDKYFNDLGIHGFRSETTQMEDYLDGIDQYFVLDHKAMLSDGEEESDSIYIGVQRSFEDKNLEVTKSPLRYIPEHLDLGPIYRVYWHDRDADYANVYDRLTTQRDKKLRAEAETSKMSYLDYLEKESKRRGISQKEFFKRRHLPAIERVIPGGRAQQYKFVFEVLTETYNQLRHYYEQEQNLARRQRLERDIAVVDLALKKAHESQEQSEDFHV